MIDLDWLQRQFPQLSDIEVLGQGGQKEVFSANHPDHGALVLKIFKIGADRERAIREARASLGLGGARVPRTIDQGVTDSPLGEVIWVFEERIPGVSLREVLAGGALPDEDVLRLAEDLLEVLAAAEALGIVHRDIKPENIIRADDGRFWVIDFGLARHLDLSSITATHLSYGVGTPGYAPVEQFRNRKAEIDGRADLFGAGVTLYEAIEGTNPLRAGARDWIEIVDRTEKYPLERIGRDLDGNGSFAELVLALTRPSRSHRPDSVADARAWLSDILSQG